MTSNTQTSNMLASVNEFVALYMVEAAKEIGGKAHGVLTKLWESKQGEFALLFAATPKKRKRKSSGKKRGKSAYMFFCAEERLKIREEDPELAPREVMSELGRRWKEAKKGDTSKWDELAKESKEEAAKANSSGEEEGPKPSVSKPKPKPKPKDEDDDDDELVEEEEDELVEEKKQPTKTST